MGTEESEIRTKAQGTAESLGEQQPAVGDEHRRARHAAMVCTNQGPTVCWRPTLMAITVLVADPHLLVADALGRALATFPDIDVLARHPINGVDALEAIHRERPDVALLDYWMPDFQAPSAVTAIHQRCPGQKVILLSWFHGPDQIRAALDAGATGFLPKSVTVDVVVEAIRRAQGGESPVFLDELLRLIDTLGRKCTEQEVRLDRLLRLTPREVAVLKRLAEGGVPRDIAQDLGIAAGTLRTHIHSILRKTETRSQLDAVAMARLEGLVSQ